MFRSAGRVKSRVSLHKVKVKSNLSQGLFKSWPVLAWLTFRFSASGVGRSLYCVVIYWIRPPHLPADVSLHLKARHREAIA